MTEEIKNKIEKKNKTQRKTTRKVNVKNERQVKGENRVKNEKNIKKESKRPYNKKMVKKHEEGKQEPIFKKSKLKIIPLRRNSRSWKKYYSI